MDWGESDEIIDCGDGQANTDHAGIDLVDDGLKTDQAGISGGFGIIAVKRI